jgi:hypothetical protein
MKKLVKEFLNEKRREKDSEGHRIGSKRSHYDKDGFVKHSGERSGKESEDYNHWGNLEKNDRLNVLEPLAVAIKGVLNRPEDFNPEFIDQITDMWFVVNKEIGKNS